MIATARGELREATKDAHERLHHMPMFASLAAGRIDRDGYIDLLKRLLGFHQPVEEAIGIALGAETFGVAIPQWRRASLLNADLAALGVNENECQSTSMFVIQQNIGSPASAMGWLYVLVGSTLGGRLLARRLDQFLLLNDTAGRLFLLNGGESEHTFWKVFCDAVEACGSEYARRNEMKTGADKAFRAFEDWFSRGTTQRHPEQPREQ
jgi:heme oxygenase